MNTCKSHQFKEHSIGAGLTRKFCVTCGDIHIGQTTWSIVGFDPWQTDEDVDVNLSTERLEMAG
ncbi:MAG TPA: hypothetical protein VFD97_06095 [Acidimicrobiia bacterium]|nr:hypothetical protein [Acidimicrobiia bacterium]